MKTKIDPDLCTACGLCVNTCPDIYEMGDDTAIVIADIVPEGMESCAIDAEESCPTGAISHSS